VKHVFWRCLLALNFSFSLIKEVRYSYPQFIWLNYASSDFWLYLKMKGSREGPVVGSCGYGNEPLGSIKAENFLTS
jgi:hypothetical protein